MHTGVDTFPLGSASAKNIHTLARRVKNTAFNSRNKVKVDN